MYRAYGCMYMYGGNDVVGFILLFITIIVASKQSASLRSAVPLPTPTSMTSSFIELTTMAKKTEKRTSLSGQGGGVQAPAPAMYWSLPSVYGKIPKPTRAHVSVVVGDLMYVFGGTDSKHCLGSLYTLELGKRKRRKKLLG